MTSGRMTTLKRLSDETALPHGIAAMRAAKGLAPLEGVGVYRMNVPYRVPVFRSCEQTIGRS